MGTTALGIPTSYTRVSRRRGRAKRLQPYPFISKHARTGCVLVVSPTSSRSSLLSASVLGGCCWSTPPVPTPPAPFKLAPAEMLPPAFAPPAILTVSISASTYPIPAAPAPPQQPPHRLVSVPPEPSTSDASCMRTQSRSIMYQTQSRIASSSRYARGRRRAERRLHFSPWPPTIGGMSRRPGE